MWKSLKRKSPLEQKKSSSLRNSLYLFAHASGGAGAIMLIGLFLTGAIFVGVAIDYDRWRTGKQQMDSALRRANIAAGTACRIMLEEGKSADQVETEVQEVFDKTFRSSEPGFIGGVAVKEGTRPALKVEITAAPTPPTPTPAPPKPSPAPTPTSTSTRSTGGMKCSVESSYEGEISTTLTRLVGMNKYYFKGYAKGSSRPSSSASSTTTTTTGGPVLIDFLLDVSGSMSTVAGADQRSMLAAVLNDPLIKDSALGNVTRSCIYVCHSPFATLGITSSQRIIDVMAGRPQDVHLWWGGVTTLRPPSNPGPKPRVITESNGISYVQLGETLDYLGIKVKSDILAQAMGIAISELKSSPGSPTTDVAFHRFSTVTESGGFKTVFPASGAYDNINKVPSDPKVLEGYFQYLVNCSDAVFAYDKFMPESGNTLVSKGEMKSKLGARFCEDNVHADSLITSNGASTNDAYEKSALWKIKEKYDKLPANLDNIKKVIVLITDGVNTPRNDHLNGANKITTAVCTKLKELPDNKKPTIMIIHTYYRLQTRDVTIMPLVERILGSADKNLLDRMDVSLSTINDVEQRFNAALAVPLKACADNYYPADNVADIEKAFRDMAQAVQTIVTTTTTTTTGEDYIPG